MKKILLLFLLIYPATIFSQPATGDGTSGNPYTGVITTPWTLAGDKYCGNLSVTSGIFTISPGATLRFGTGNSLTLSGTASLYAVGNSSGIITFTAATASWGHIYFNNPSDLNQSNLEYCLIEFGDVRSSSPSYGGGIYANDYNNLLISYCTIRNNKATHGAGIMAYNNSSTPTITNCFIYGNAANTSGGGLYLPSGCTSVITNCIVSNNSTGNGGGGGIFLDACSNVRVVNSNFVNNTTSAVVRGFNIQYYNISNPTNRPRFINCITWGSDNSITHLNASYIATDFVNCAIQDILTPAGSYTSCIALSGTNDLGGPNFIDPVLPGVDWNIKVVSPCRDAGVNFYSGVSIPPNDIFGSPTLNTKDIGACEVQYNGWKISASSTDWNTAGNWNLGIPTSSQNIVIPSGAANYPTGSSGLNFTIGANYGLILDPGAKATFATLTNNGDLKLRSDASDISSLITGNNVNAVVEMYLTGGGSQGTYKWHYISVPTTNNIAASIFTTGITYDLAGYNEPRVSTDVSQGWIGYDGWIYSAPDTYDYDYDFNELTLGRGYEYWDNNNNKFTFSGTLNSADVSPVATFKPGGIPAVNGFNLLGNPFPSGLDWNYIISHNYPENTSKSLFFTRNNVWCTYINGVGVPGDINGLIPPMQGFMVKTYVENHSISLVAAARTHSMHARYKKGESVIPLVRLSLSENDLSDETVVRFDYEAKAELDNDFDAVKMNLSASNLLIYSSMSGTKYTINGQPFPESSLDIPIVVNLLSSGNHSINATQLQGLDNYRVQLIDNFTGFTASLKTDPVLTFASSSSGSIADRFILRISNAITGVEDPVTKTGKFNIYQGLGNINIQTLNSDWEGKPGSVKILDLTGKLLSQHNIAEFSKSSVIQIPAPAGKGLVVVEIKSGIARYVGKVIIK